VVISELVDGVEVVLSYGIGWFPGRLVLFLLRVVVVVVVVRSVVSDLFIVEYIGSVEWIWSCPS
jgi:hypothetical protein